MTSILVQWKTRLASTLVTLCLCFPGTIHAGAPKVWVNTSTGIYHCPGGQYFGNTRQGKFVSEDEARSQGHRPAYGQPCAGSASASSSATARGLLNAPAASSTGRVWVNSSSSVYHCPGSRYYGATKRGTYMTEAQAIAQGNRPAYGSRC